MKMMQLEQDLREAWRLTFRYIGPLLLLTVVHFVVCICSLGILAPVVTAGYVQSLLELAREDRIPQVGDLFSEMSLFLPLFGFGVVVVLAVSLGLMLLIIPGVALGCFVLFASFYLMPLMTDRRMGLVDALKASWEMGVRYSTADHSASVLAYFVLFAIGYSISFGVIPFGVLLVQPMATFILIIAYEDRVRRYLQRR